MNKIMEKLNKLTLPITILLASIILGGFFYASQINKQRSIEKQQQIKIEQSKQEWLAKGLKEQEAKEQVYQALNVCLADAENKWKNWGQQLSKMADECRINDDGICKTAEAFVEAFDKNDAQLQQDKAECFKKYPQK